MKKLLVALLVGAMAFAMAACGNEAPADDAQPPVSTEAEAPADEPADETPAGPAVYTWEEPAMGGAFTVTWTLTLNEDGTFTLLEANPVMGDTTYTGTEWTQEGDVVTTGALSGGTPMAEFFNDDLSCEWTVNADGTMVAVNFDPNATPVIDGEGAPEGELPSLDGEMDGELPPLDGEMDGELPPLE